MLERAIIPLRPPTAPPPEAFSTFRHVNRGFVLVSEALWYEYHARRRQNATDWLGGGTTQWTLDVFSAALAGERSANESLRAWVRELAKDYPGTYLVPV